MTERTKADRELGTFALLRTKLHRPLVPRDLIPRPHLLERLEAEFGPRLILLSAPAGSGKTTLLCQWLEHYPHPSAWLSLDEGDSDFGQFLTYVVAAIQTLFPNACVTTLSLLRGAELPPVDYLATVLSNEIEEQPGPFVLVLDDYHCIEDRSIHALLDRLVRHPPANLCLVLASRSDPPLSLGRARAFDRLTELRASDLRFSVHEAEAFLSRATGKSVPPKVMTALDERMEGWPAGLRFVALSLRGKADSSGIERGLRWDGERFIAEYLLDEVILRQPPVIQDFLLRTSILNRFCAALCDAVMLGAKWAGSGEPPWALRPAISSGAVLEDMERASLFLIPLDDQHGWYRYHHFFQEVLQSKLRARLSPEELAAVHRRAGAWYADNGFVGEAVRHALAAGDVARACRIVESKRHLATEREDWLEVERWLRMLPEDAIQTRPELIAAQAWIMQSRGNWSRVPGLLRTAEAILSRGPTADDHPASTVRGELDVLWASLFCFAGNAQRCLAYAQRAVAQIRPGISAYYNGWAVFYLGMGYQLSGQAIRAVRELNRILHEEGTRDGIVASLSLLGLAVVHLMAGRLAEMERTAQHFLRLESEAGRAMGACWGHYFLGVVNYERGNLEVASRHFSAVVAQRDVANGWALRDSLLGLALVQAACDRPARAAETIASLTEHTLQRHDVDFLRTVYAFQARLSLMHDNLEEAEHWLELAQIEPDQSPMLFLEVPRITQAKVLLARGDRASLRQGLEILADLERQAAAESNTRRLIEIMAVQAMTCRRLGREGEALDRLERAVRLAEPGGCRRTFVDLGEDLAVLLRRLAWRGVTPEYLGGLLAAFAAPDGAEARPLPSTASKVTGAAPDLSPLVEPLTGRELEVLGLLSLRLSNQEIARTLVISEWTVKKHATNVFQKLGASGRREAVSRARALGIPLPR